MYPLLCSLDLTAGDGSASSAQDLHPIRNAAVAHSRAIPLLLSLGLTPLLIYGIANGLITQASSKVRQRTFDQVRMSPSLLLQEPDNPDIRPPVLIPVGPAEPGGEGHHEGTGTLDPRLAAYTSYLSQPSDAIDPEAWSATPKTERAFLSLNPALPMETSGNGLAVGRGRDSANGPGGLIRPPIAFDFQLIPTRQVLVQAGLPFGQETAAREPVVVRILIGEDGVPFKATVLSGPSFLHERCISAALDWRFEALAPHGLTAPLALDLTFHPHILRKR